MSTTMRRLLLAGALALAPLSAKAEAPAEKIGVSLPALALLGAALLHRQPEKLVEGGGARSVLRGVPGRRPAGRRGAGRLLGCRRDRLRAGHPRRRPVRPDHHRPHERRVEDERPDGACRPSEAILKDPKQLAGQKLLVTTNSTADFAARNCLKKWGLGPRDLRFVNLGQAQIISAVIADAGEVVGVWAPNTYTLEEKANAQVICSGADAGAVVPGALVVRADYAKAHPAEVAKFLAVYLRGWGWAKANPKEAHAMTKRFYAEGGVEVSDRAIDQEFALRPTYPLDAQLKLMARGAGASEVDTWFAQIGGFMAEVGTIPKAPDAKSFIDDAFLKRVADDPKLRAFATEFDASGAQR